MGVADTAAADAERYMQIALQMAERGMAAGGPPVGACLVRNDELIAAAHNAVIAELDITAHAEIAVIRQACQELKSLNLDGCVLYVTVEPCPMCLAASHYAGINEIIFGASIDEFNVVTGSELCLHADELLSGHSDLQVHGGVLANKCNALIDNWRPFTGSVKN